MASGAGRWGDCLWRFAVGGVAIGGFGGGAFFGGFALALLLALGGFAVGSEALAAWLATIPPWVIGLFRSSGDDHAGVGNPGVLNWLPWDLGPFAAGDPGGDDGVRVALDSPGRAGDNFVKRPHAGHRPNPWPALTLLAHPRSLAVLGSAVIAALVCPCCRGWLPGLGR